MRFVDLVQTAFREDELMEEATWQAVVLISEGKKYYWGIGLVVGDGGCETAI